MRVILNNFRVNYLRKFSKEAQLAKVFYIVMSLQIMIEAVFFYILPGNSDKQLYS